MADFTYLWKTPVDRDLGIDTQAIAAGANYLGSEVDNLVNLDPDGTMKVRYNNGSTPSSGTYIEVYILYDFSDSGAYEEGDATPTDPIKEPVKTIALEEDNSANHDVVFGVALLPHPFKVLVKSESDQSCTVTVELETHNPHAMQDA